MIFSVDEARKGVQTPNINIYKASCAFRTSNFKSFLQTAAWVVCTYMCTERCICTHTHQQTNKNIDKLIQSYVNQMSSEAATRRGALSEERKLLSSLSTVTALSNMGYPAYLNGSNTSPYRLYKIHWPFNRSNNLHGWGPCNPCMVAYKQSLQERSPHQLLENVQRSLIYLDPKISQQIPYIKIILTKNYFLLYTYKHKMYMKIQRTS